VNFSVARHFTTLFANLLLERKMPADVDLLKVDIPDGATLETPWELTRQSRHRYYAAIPPRRTRWDEPVVIDYQIDVDPATLPKDSDIFALMVKKVVSVTPLSIDLTSRVNLEEFGNDLRK
jgi:5'-nucleotidase